MSKLFETVSLVAQSSTGEVRLLPASTVLVADTEDGVIIHVKVERFRVLALSIVRENAFLAVWHLICKWPAAVGYAELLALFDGESAEDEQAVIDAAVGTAMLDVLAGDFQREIAAASEQLEMFGLEIVEVQEFGYKVQRKEQGE